MIIAPGSTDVTLYFKLVDPATGAPETGLVIASLDATYVRDRTAAVKNDLSTPVGFLVNSAHTDNAAIQVDAVNAPGLYRVDFPDATFAAGVMRVQLVINGATIDPAVIEAEMPAWLTPITGATARAVNGADAALAIPGSQMDLVNAPNGTAITAIQLGLATTANQTTILARLGAWTGAGLNTILGAFRALLNKAVAAPADIGGTFDPATDSTEAIQEQIANLDGDLVTVNTNLDGDIAGVGAQVANLDGDLIADTAAILAAIGGVCTLGPGAIEFIYAVTDVITGLPIGNCQVWVTTDPAGANVIANGITDAFGNVTFWLDPGPAYFFREHPSYTFSNPDSETVV